MFHLINSDSKDQDNSRYDYLVDGFSSFFNRPGIDINPENPIHLIYIDDTLGAIGAARLFSTKEMSLEKKNILSIGFTVDDRIWECNRIVFFDRVVRRYIKDPEDFSKLKRKFYDELYATFRKIASEKNINVILSVHSQKDHDELVSLAKWPFLLETQFKYPTCKGSGNDVLAVLPIF